MFQCEHAMRATCISLVYRLNAIVISEDEDKGKILQNCLSLLNRDIVLECPQLNVPWFSEMCFTENFCNADQRS